MERCLEEISSTVLDAGEPLSYRTLSIRCQVPASVSLEALAHFSAENRSVTALQLLVKRGAINNSDKSETGAAKNDPRARVLSLEARRRTTKDEVVYQQTYALYSKPKAASEDEDEVEAVATACWAQERQARNKVFDTVSKHAPLSKAVEALYASGIKCAEATARQDFGEEQGEETVSAFDAINTLAKKKPSSSSTSSSFFKSSNKTAVSKVSSSRRNGESKMTDSRKQETTKLDMNNVLTVDSDDEEEDETDAPVFVKSKSNKRIISDEDEDEDTAPSSTETRTPALKSRNVKRKLNASPAKPQKANQTEESDEGSHSNTIQTAESEEEADDDSVERPVLDTKRRVLVTKTHINEQGYMVTEKTYEEVELTSEEIEKEQKAAKIKVEKNKKKKVVAEKAAKAKKEKQSGPPKQRDLRSFFSTK